jgi:hypothetical protein
MKNWNFNTEQIEQNLPRTGKQYFLMCAPTITATLGLLTSSRANHQTGSSFWNIIWNFLMFKMLLAV